MRSIKYIKSYHSTLTVSISVLITFHILVIRAIKAFARLHTNHYRTRIHSAPLTDLLAISDVDSITMYCERGLQKTCFYLNECVSLRVLLLHSREGLIN